MAKGEATVNGTTAEGDGSLEGPPPTDAGTANAASINTYPGDVERAPGLQDSEDEEVQLTGLGATLCCDPRRGVHRFYVLIYMCFLSFGSYFCYDNPGALQDEVKSDMHVNTSEYMALYSLYSWPNVILCFFGGFLIDRVFGIRLGAIIFSTIIFVGQIVFALGGIVDQYWVMELGRFIFGVGGESLAVAQNTYACSWFMGKELNMVFGLQISISRVGSTVNFNVMEPLYSAINKIYSGSMCLGITLMIASLTCLLSLACALIIAYYDKRAERILHKKRGETGEVVQLKDTKDFPLSFWMISLICVGYYVAIFPFTALGVVFYERKFQFSPADANLVNSLIYIISAFASPVFGFAIDKTGRNIIWVFISVLATIGSHSLLAFTFVNPFVAVVCMGLAFSLLASALWPMVALIIQEHQLGTAYGVMQSVQNLGLAVISLVTGVLVDSYGYLVLEVFFLACLCLALVGVIVLWLVDSMRNGLLNLSVEGREKRTRELATAEALERAKLLASGSMADVTPQDLLHSRSEFHIRNRYLSKIGVQLPSTFRVSTSALIHRTGLK